MAELIDKNHICFRCSYGGGCMADIEDCKICIHYVCDYEDIQNLPTTTESEIRAKAIDEFAEKLGILCENRAMALDRYNGRPLYNKDGKWHDLINEVAEQLKERE